MRRKTGEDTSTNRPSNSSSFIKKTKTLVRNGLKKKKKKKMPKVFLDNAN